MKKFTTLPLGLLLFALIQLTFSQTAFAQTGNSRIVIRVTVGGVSTDFYDGECGFGAANFGAFPSEQLCAPAEWAHDVIGLDSLVCDSIPVGSLTGKIALVRRGGCPVAADGAFAAKSKKAQKAGAVAVLVANNNATATHTDCTAPILGGTDTSIHIPVFSLSRSMALFIDNAFNSGNPVEICLHPPNVFVESTFYPVQNVQTPVSQIATDTFGFSANITNVRGLELTNVKLKASVLTSTGTELYSTDLLIPTLSGEVSDSVFNLPGLYPPELPVGDYQIVYTTESDALNGDVFRDTTTGNVFHVTANLFAKDDGPVNGLRPGTLPPAGWATGVLYQMVGGSLDNYEVNTVEFAHAVNTGDRPINQIGADLFLFRVNDDVADDWSLFEGTQGFQSPSLVWQGVGSYIAPSNAANFQIQPVTMIDLFNPDNGVQLDNGASYILAAFYPDSSATAFQAFDTDVMPAGPNGISTLTFSSQWFLGGFTGNPSAVLRMYIDLVVTTDEQALPDSYMNVFPNPAKDVVNLGLNLDKAADMTVTIADVTGRTVYIEDHKNMTNETLTYKIGQLASGTYLARIATKEGTLTKKFIVQK